MEIFSNINYDFIIQKQGDNEFGGDFGANENNVAVAVSWSSKDTPNYKLKPTDVVR